MKQTTKQKQKRKSAMLVATLAMMLWLPMHAWAQHGLFDHENYGSRYVGGFNHQDYGDNYSGSFMHEVFGGNYSGSFMHEAFGDGFLGNFTHESFGSNYDGGFTHEGFGSNFNGDFDHEDFGDVPLASGLFVLTLAGAAYAVKKRSKNKKDNKQQIN